MTFLDFATGAYRISRIVGSTATPSAEQGAKAVERMNDMMASLAEDGIDLGWAPIDTTADTISLPLGHVEGLKNMLAMRLTAESGFDIQPLVADTADRAYRRLLGQFVSMQITRAQSDTLPVGENQRYGYSILTDN